MIVAINGFIAPHGGVIKSETFPRNWPFVWGIHRSPVNSPYKGQWRGALMFVLIRAWINVWVNNRKAGDLRRYRAHYDVTVMHPRRIIFNFGGIMVARKDKIVYLYHSLLYSLYLAKTTSQWRHNGSDGVSNHQHHHCILNRLFRSRSKKTSKLRVTGLYAVNSPLIGEFPAQRASNAENVSIWWRHHVGLQ